MSSNSTAIIDDIKDLISEIEETLQGIGFNDYRSDRRRMIFVVRRLETILNNLELLDEDFREKHKDIPWDEVADYRSKILGNSFEINEQEVWTIAKIKLMKLKKILYAIDER
jgi:uncharacterized protein with HEPN domain